MRCIRDGPFLYGGPFAHFGTGSFLTIWPATHGARRRQEAEPLAEEHRPFVSLDNHEFEVIDPGCIEWGDRPREQPGT